MKNIALFWCKRVVGHPKTAMFLSHFFFFLYALVTFVLNDIKLKMMLKTFRASDKLICAHRGESNSRSILSQAHIAVALSLELPDNVQKL